MILDFELTQWFNWWQVCRRWVDACTVLWSLCFDREVEIHVAFKMFLRRTIVTNSIYLLVWLVIFFNRVQRELIHTLMYRYRFFPAFCIKFFLCKWHSKFLSKEHINHLDSHHDYCYDSPMNVHDHFLSSISAS